MLSRYHQPVDPDAPNSAHAMALGLIGWNKRVLELGAASGHVTRVLVERHCDVTAVEHDIDFAKELEGLAGTVVAGDLNDPGLLEDLPGDFDVVLAGDVLEHLLAPDQVLRGAARLLVPGGRLVVSLPNVAHADVRMSLLEGRWDYQPWGLMDRTHLRFFTLQTIETMVEQAGLVMTDLSRVRVPAFESELEIDRAAIPTEVVNHILADPESETYQFVLAAVREGEDDHVRRLASEKQWLEVQLERERIARAAADAELTELRQRALEREEQVEHEHGAELAELDRHREEDALAHRVELDSANAELDSAVVELGSAHAELEAVGGQLRRVEESVTWQTFRRLRAGVFRAAGGERSLPVRFVQAGLRGFGRAALRRRRG